METMITVITGVAVGVIVGFVKRYLDKRDEREENKARSQEEREKEFEKRLEQRDRDNQRREKLSLDFMNATASVTKEAVACMLNNKEPNGELRQAFDYMQEVKHNLEDYERERASR